MIGTRNNMVIFVFGGLGFIGSNFLNKFNLKDGNTYYCFDILNASGELDNINSKINFIECNILDLFKLDEVFNKYHPDLVINFAAESSVDYSFINPNIFDDVNYRGVINLFNMCKKYKIKRFHQCSTDEVYGSYENKEDLKTLQGLPKINPSNPYATSKAKADKFLLENKDSLNITISRSNNVFGLNQGTDKLIPNAIYNLIKDSPIKIYGDGKNTRNWIDIDIVISFLHELLLDLNPKKVIFHLASSLELSNIDIAHLILKTLELKSDRISFVLDRKINDLRYHLQMDDLDLEILNSYNKDNLIALKIVIKKMYEEKKEYLIKNYNRLLSLKRIRCL